MLMKTAGASIVSAVLIFSNLAMAETSKVTTKEDLAKKKVAELSCEDFNGLDATFKPTVIAWAAGYQKGDSKPDSVAVDIDGIEKVTPFVVEACQKEPKASFWEKVEAELKKVF